MIGLIPIKAMWTEYSGREEQPSCVLLLRTKMHIMQMLGIKSTFSFHRFSTFKHGEEEREFRLFGWQVSDHTTGRLRQSSG